MEQLQRWLDGDPLDHLSTPLFIPSSTLLSMPTTILHPPTAKTRDQTLTQVWRFPSPHSVILGQIMSFWVIQTVKVAGLYIWSAAYTVHLKVVISYIWLQMTRDSSTIFSKCCNHKSQWSCIFIVLTLQEPEPDDLSDKADWPKTTPVSMAWRLKELERQILASQEEELACRLKLGGLLSIVDDWWTVEGNVLTNDSAAMQTFENWGQTSLLPAARDRFDLFALSWQSVAYRVHSVVNFSSFSLRSDWLIWTVCVLFFCVY